ncbi:MAG: ribonuclease H-like domain-containing protein [Spirochaetes bacterium]|nr:ribonuclease H-like domain-containing protein [Spirochaetota bacterium]
MIQGCFRHIHGIGPKTASRLNDLGFLAWEDCFSRESSIPFNGKKRKKFLEEIRRSIESYDSRDIGYFTESFPTSEQWRILGEYLPGATFIDVETTGLSWNYCHASVIAAYHRGELHAFVYGENLDDFLYLADESELLVTYNGTSFDIPFIEKTFNIPSLNRPHVDLRWIAWHKGYHGGLKSIERRLGIQRPPQVEGIDGFEAVDLYYRWQQGDPLSRDLLVSYCEADVLSTYLVAERILIESGCTVNQIDLDKAFSLIECPGVII